MNRFAIYRFEKGAKVNLNDVSALQAVTYDNFYRIPYVSGKKYVYVVTALDRVGNESKGKKKKISFLDWLDDINGKTVKNRKTVVLDRRECNGFFILFGIGGAGSPFIL